MIVVDWYNNIWTLSNPSARAASRLSADIQMASAYVLRTDTDRTASWKAACHHTGHSLPTLSYSMHLWPQFGRGGGGLSLI